MYNVEIRVSDHEIDDLGRDQAIARATLSAWHHAIGNAHPKRSLILRSTEEWKGQVTDLPCLYIRFCFDVD